jgi:hypothetical protein
MKKEPHFRLGLFGSSTTGEFIAESKWYAPRRLTAARSRVDVLMPGSGPFPAPAAFFPKNRKKIVFFKNGALYFRQEDTMNKTIYKTVINTLSVLAVMSFFVFYFLEVLKICPVSERQLATLMILGIAGIFTGFANLSSGEDDCESPPADYAYRPRHQERRPALRMFSRRPAQEQKLRSGNRA